MSRYSSETAEHEETLKINGTEITFRLFVEQDDTPLKGNLLAWKEAECPGCHWWPNDEKPKRKVAIGDRVPFHYPKNDFPLNGLDPDVFGYLYPMRRCEGTHAYFVDSDEKAEKEANNRLDSGDVWAWAMASATATLELPDGSSVRGESSWMGGLQYDSERAFLKDSDAWGAMKEEAFSALRDSLKATEEEARAERRKARAAKSVLAKLPDALPVEESA